MASEWSGPEMVPGPSAQKRAIVSCSGLRLLTDSYTSFAS